jgi:hypothetical protein
MRAAVAISVLLLATLAGAGSGRGENPTTAPVVVTGVAQAGDWFAFLNGTVDPVGLDTQAWFEWGLTPEFGSATSIQVVPAGNPGSVRDRIDGLESFTKYYFRIVATNASGTAFGDVVSFGTLDTVLPPPPRRCRVPRVVGLRLAAAGTRIRKAGCRVAVGRVRSKRPKGIVLSQTPKGGTSASVNKRVRLVVSRGRR